MDFLTRILGGSYTPRKPPPKPAAEQNRFTKFKSVISSIQRILSSTKRDLAREDVLLNELQQLFERLVELIRQETRAPYPHLCVQFAATHQVFTIVSRAASVSFHEGCIRAAIGLMSALVDSEEENFMTSDAFAKSLMRLVTRIIDGTNMLLSVETETQIMELLFTISAKIRLQPSILRHWFSPSRRLHQSDEDEKQGLINIASKDDFQLAYILVDRVYHEGRIGDFSRTGILYIFEASSNDELSDWIITSSDICTLLASGLGALYSQLARELSILHPDATLPAVLAMSDYDTSQTNASAESAFSERHLVHITTFLQYLLFWQDILAHTKSEDVKQTLLDHFQILFLRQLLYPSVLQSSDTDGSSVAVLTYLKAIVEGLEHTDLIDNILSYLLAMDTESSDARMSSSITSRMSTTLQRRESLMSLTSLKDSEDVVEPHLFNLVDLIQSSLRSAHGQTVFSALQLVSILLERQTRFVFGTILKLPLASTDALRTAGALQVEVEQYMLLASKLHSAQLDRAIDDLASDVRTSIELQVASKSAQTDQAQKSIGRFTLLPRQSVIVQQLFDLLASFWTNSIEVNMALTHSIVALASCVEIRGDQWLGLDPAGCPSQDRSTRSDRVWQNHLTTDEHASVIAVRIANARPDWPRDEPVVLFAALASLVSEIDPMRSAVPGLDNLIAARKIMLQANSLDIAVDGPFSRANSPAPSRPGSALRSHSAVRSGPALSPSRIHTLEVKAADSALSSNHTSETPDQARSEDRTEEISAARLDAQTLRQTAGVESPSTTDILMQEIHFQPLSASKNSDITPVERTTSLNHALTNIIVLQEFILEIVAVLQARACVLGEAEIRIK